MEDGRSNKALQQSIAAGRPLRGSLWRLQLNADTFGRRASMEGRFEKVYTMTDYYDGPRRGIADFEGEPHFYDSEWSDGEDLDTDTFRLTAVTADLLALALEDWAIWRRWETAFHEGRVDTTPHPALPEDRTRHDELQPILGKQLVTSPEQYVRARAEFRWTDIDPDSKGWRPLEVRWARC